MNPEPTPEPRADARAAFQAEARRILVLDGGINDRSRLKLQLLAKKFSMAPEELSAAINQAMGRDEPRPSASDPARKFRIGVEARLAKEGILTPALRWQLEEIGRRKFALPDAAIAEVIRAAAAARGAAVISPAEATAHVADLIAGLSRSRGRLSASQVEVVHATAAELGLDREHVDRLLLRTTRATTRVRRARSRLARIASVGLSLAVGVGSVAGFLYVVRDTSEPIASQTSPGAATVPGPGSGSDAPLATTSGAPIPAWIGPEVSAAIEEAIRHLLAFEATFRQLVSPSEADRAGALTVLIERPARAETEREAQTDHVGPILADFYRIEPSDSNARLIRDGLLGLFPGDRDDPPIKSGSYDRASWSLQVILSILGRADVEAARADDLARGLEAALGSTVDRTLKPDALAGRCREALARRFNAALIARANAARWPAGTLALHAILRPRFETDLPPEVNEALSNEFLVAFLDVHGAAWMKLTAEIDASLQAHDRALVLKLVDLYEQVKDDSLRAHLEQGLAARSGVVPTSTPPGGLAAAFREALKAPVTRPEKFHAAAAEALAAIKAAPDALESILQETVKLAHASALGCALAQGEGGLAKFDELFDRPPNWGPAIPTVAAAPGVNLGQQGGQVAPISTGMAPMSGNDQAIDQALRDLAQATDRDMQERPLFTLNQYGIGSDPPPRRLLAVASLLLHGQSGLDALLRLPRVQMALADTLAESDAPFSQGHVEQVVTLVIGQDVRFGRDRRWREKARKLLALAALRQLDPTIDAAAGALRDLYRDQGLLLGMDPSEFLLMTRPSQVVEAVVSHLSERLSREADVDSIGEEDRALLARIPHELEAARFLAEDDVQRTLLMQRIWLRLLALDLTARKPPRAGAVADILNAEPDQARDATHVLQQLRRGEEQILRLWMLRNDLSHGLNTD